MCRRPVGRMPLTTRFFFVSAANRIDPFLTPAKLCHPETSSTPASTEVRRRFQVLGSAQGDNKKQKRKRPKRKGKTARAQRHPPRSAAATTAETNSGKFDRCKDRPLRPLQTKVARDDHALDLAGALVDGDYAGVAVHALDIGFARIT